jgi:hypothetical protein
MSFGQCFDNSAIEYALKVRRELTYGMIVIDGDEATLGSIVAGTSFDGQLFKIAHMTANIASRTRRGGQSAARYSRNRDGEELAFLRKVAEKMVGAFGDVRHILVGGRADMKRKLVAQLPHSMRDRLARIVELPCHADMDGLKKLSAHMQEVAELDKNQEQELALGRFMDSIDRTDMHDLTLVCYGETQTLAALKMGIVEELFLAMDSAGSHDRSHQWRELAAATGASVIDVHPKTSQSTRFCTGIGVGACLRYAVDTNLMEAPVVSDSCIINDHDSPAPNAVETRKNLLNEKISSELEEDCESNSTAPSEAESVLHKWLVEALQLTLQDTLVAESLAVGAELILFDDAVDLSERLQTAVDMLRGEGVQEDVLMELTYHVSDYFGVGQ